MNSDIVPHENQLPAIVVFAFLVINTKKKLHPSNLRYKFKVIHQAS
jgi:hypothetical protein